jgi:hypothetical protein
MMSLDVIIFYAKKRFYTKVFSPGNEPIGCFIMSHDISFLAKLSSLLAIFMGEKGFDDKSKCSHVDYNGLVCMQKNIVSFREM